MRGEIWTVAGGGIYAGRPRPAVIVQGDAFDATGSVTLCFFTTDATEAPLFRVPVESTAENGLASRSSLMVDRITTVPGGKLGKLVGRLGDGDRIRLNRAMMVFLGLADTPRTPGQIGS